MSQMTVKPFDGSPELFFDFMIQFRATIQSENMQHVYDATCGNLLETLEFKKAEEIWAGEISAETLAEYAKQKFEDDSDFAWNIMHGLLKKRADRNLWKAEQPEEPRNFAKALKKLKHTYEGMKVDKLMYLEQEYAVLRAPEEQEKFEVAKVPVSNNMIKCHECGRERHKRPNCPERTNTPRRQFRNDHRNNGRGRGGHSMTRRVNYDDSSEKRKWEKQQGGVAKSHHFNIASNVYKSNEKVNDIVDVDSVDEFMLWDSCCSTHMFNDIKYFIEYTEKKTAIDETTGGKGTQSHGYGKACIVTRDVNNEKVVLTLKHALYVPELVHNLFSHMGLLTAGHSVERVDDDLFLSFRSGHNATCVRLRTMDQKGSHLLGFPIEAQGAINDH